MDKTFDAAASEPRIYAEWERTGAFAAGAGAAPGAETFCIVIPPPNVTGSLHMGHALNNTLQDVLVRWHRMRGHDTLWQPGTDHAGIATQMVVERELARRQEPSRREMGRERFVEKVWAYKEKSGGEILNQLKRLGASCDWSRERFTMDAGLHDAVLRVFVALYREGLIYKDKRLVNWDPHFETAISDLEVEQVEERGHLWRFRYPLADGATYDWPTEHDEDGNATAWEKRDYVVVATTRPETMLGDTGVAVHPDDARYAGIVGKDVILPLVGRRIPVVADGYADPAKGTGAVKITPAHDFNDFEVGRRAGLRALNIFDTSARIRHPTAMSAVAQRDVVKRAALDWPDGTKVKQVSQSMDDAWEREQLSRIPQELRGQDRFDARKMIVELAQVQDWIDARGDGGVQEEVHVVPHGDRSKTPVEPYLTDQWFVDAGTLAQPALAAVREGRTRFVPEPWEKTYFNWLENIEPWCISRQLWWGHRIPVWYGPDGTPFCEASEEEAQAAANRHYGESAALTQDEDVLDTWFSSALWPFSTLGWPEQTPELKRYYPTDVLITGFDIIFFWVARMMMFGLQFMEDEAGAPQVPFHTVYVHALVRDEDGKKMSKSLGNVIDPLELVDEYGADAVRFTLTSMAAQGRDIKLAVSRVEGYRNFVTKLWNAARLAEMNGCTPLPGFDPASPRHPVNRWIVGETARVAAATDEALGAFRFNDAANGLYAHVWGVFCDWYLELAKPLLQGRDRGSGSGTGSSVKAETQATVAWALDQCLKLLHPIMPFVTEALWGQIAPRETLLIHAAWPALRPELADAEADRDLRWTIRLIEAVRSVRAEMNVPAGAEIEMVLTGHDAETGHRLLRHSQLIRRLARLAEVAVAEEAPAGSVTVALEDCAVNLPLRDVIDIAAERARLEKALARTAKEAAQLEGKLANAKFLAKAPEPVVAEQRARLATARAEREKLEAARERLEAMS